MKVSNVKTRNTKSSFPIKKDSILLKEILQILSFLVIPGYIVLYFFDRTDRETISFDFFFYIHIFLMALAFCGLMVSFKNTLVAGIIYLFFCIIVASTVYNRNFDLAYVSIMVLDVIMGVVLLIMGLLFIVNWFQKRSKWD